MESRVYYYALLKSCHALAHTDLLFHISCCMPPTAFPSHRFKALLFDLDGTLINSAPDLQRAINAALATIKARPLTIDETHACLGDGLAVMLEKALRLTGVTGHTVEEMMPTYTSIYAGIRAEPSCIYPGVREWLAEEKQRGTHLALCTNKNEKPARRILGDLDLVSFFDVILGGDSLPQHKPDPAQLIHALQAFAVKPADALMIGDSINDALAAQALGIPCLILKHGYGLPGLAELPVVFADNVADGRIQLAHI